MKFKRKAVVALAALMLFFTGCNLTVPERILRDALTQIAEEPKPSEVIPEGIAEEIPAEQPEEVAAEPEEAAAEPEETEETEDAEKHVQLRVTESGWDVFVPSSSDHPDYRFGPSIIRNEDGSIDAWFSAPGDGSREYDYITYKHSENGGQTWSDEQVVLTPTPNSPDALSVCDPDVFIYDGYYYLGYSSTINRTGKGLCNSTFLARSRRPDGPYEKWNGRSWGGSPIPFIYFDGVSLGWGSGEPSFVIVDDVLYVYSTKDSFSAIPERIKFTEVRTADLTKDDWPAHLVYQGNAVDRSDCGEPYAYSDADSWDVAYIEEIQKFIAIDTNRRFKTDSCLLYYESDDGIHFSLLSELNQNVIMRCHNCGIMTDGSGHIKKDDPVLIGYGYGGSNHSRWGVWGTRFAPARIRLTKKEYCVEEDCENLKVPMQCRAGVGSASPIMLKTDHLVYRKTLGSGPFSIAQYLRDGYNGGFVIPKSDVTFEGYDRKILSVDKDNNIQPLSAGITPVRVIYQGHCREISVCIIPDQGSSKEEVVGFCQMTDLYEIPLHQPFILKVRPMAVSGYYSMHELSGPEIMRIGLTFTSEDPAVCDVWGDGSLIPLSAGETYISVKTEIGLGYRVKVEVF